MAKIFFSDIQSVNLNYHTPSHKKNFNTKKLLRHDLVKFANSRPAVALRIYMRSGSDPLPAVDEGAIRKNQLFISDSSVPPSRIGSGWMDGWIYLWVLV